MKIKTLTLFEDLQTEESSLHIEFLFVLFLFWTHAIEYLNQSNQRKALRINLMKLKP